MIEKKYDLGFGCKGNGITVWNRLEIKAGDYKTIAHISNEGKINYYGNELPESVKRMIESQALDMENKHRFGQNNDFMNFLNNK